MTISQGSGTKPSGGTVTGERPLPVATPGPRTAAGAPTAPATDRRSGPAYDYERFSRLAGPLTDPVPGPDGVHRVRYRGLPGRRLRSFVLPVAAPLLSLALLVWVMRPEHWVHRDHVPWWQTAADLVMLASDRADRDSSGWSTWPPTRTPRWWPATRCRCGPRPGRGSRSSPPSCRARSRWRWCGPPWTARCGSATDGPLDVWLLDEGDDRRRCATLCARLGRAALLPQGRRARGTRPQGAFRARTKHGNYNAWLDAHGDDVRRLRLRRHRPRAAAATSWSGCSATSATRTSAFVVGPQVYGNYDDPGHQGRRVPAVPLPRADPAGRQRLRRADVRRHQQRRPDQRAAGRSAACTTRSPRTWPPGSNCTAPATRRPAGAGARSTPRTCSPSARARSSWTDFFTQQLRWCRGTYETLLKQFWRAPFSLSPGRLFNYTLLVIFYPMSAAQLDPAAPSPARCSSCWAPPASTSTPQIWLMLYGDAAALQIGLYIWQPAAQRQPARTEGSSGAAGMIMSALSAPDLRAVAGGRALLRRTSELRGHPQGRLGQPRPAAATFRIHLFWAARLRRLAARLLLPRPPAHRHAHLGGAGPADRRRADRWSGCALDRRPRRRPAGRGRPACRPARSRAKEPTCELAVPSPRTRRTALGRHGRSSSWPG